MNKDTQIAIRRAKNGDMQAFAEVFESLRPTVSAVAYRLVGGNDADDVVMETYLKAWKALPSYNERSALKTWLYRITYNTAMDLLRSRGRWQSKVVSESALENRSLNDLVDENQATPACELAKSEISALVRNALSLLDKEHRTIILLRFADGLSYKEIAAAAGINMGTVMSRIFNGKKKLLRLVNLLEKQRQGCVTENERLNSIKLNQQRNESDGVENG